MALNQIVYFPNPTKSKSVGSTVTANGATTVYTAPTDNIRVKGFSIVMSGLANSANDASIYTIKIGTAEFIVTLPLPSTTVIASVSKSSVDFDCEGAWLNSGDTITATKADLVGTPGILVHCSCAFVLEDYNQ